MGIREQDFSPLQTIHTSSDGPLDDTVCVVDTDPLHSM